MKEDNQDLLFRDYTDQVLTDILAKKPSTAINTQFTKSRKSMQKNRNRGVSQLVQSERSIVVETEQLPDMIPYIVNNINKSHMSHKLVNSVRNHTHNNNSPSWQTKFGFGVPDYGNDLPDFKLAKKNANLFAQFRT